MPSNNLRPQGLGFHSARCGTIDGPAGSEYPLSRSAQASGGWSGTILPISIAGSRGRVGGRLAKAGAEVVALARGAHLAAIRKRGLRVEGPLGDDTMNIQASDDAGRARFEELATGRARS